MKTQFIPVQDNNFNELHQAANVICNGGLVAFPTETVYGLGANALSKEAVQRIYIAKGRPSDNPLIIHISQKEDIYSVAHSVSTTAELLMEKFWPGPLTLVFEKNDCIPLETSGGLNTVAVRLPQHIVARKLIEYSKCPIAAPSANLSGRPSPTTAEHVKQDLDNKIDMIVDGGASVLGLESTVLDVTSDVPMLLRPGNITIEMLQSVVGDILIDPVVLNSYQVDNPKSPGMKYKHYSPSADITLYEGDLPNVVCEINKRLAYSNKENTGVLATEQTKDKYNTATVLVMGDRENPETIASNLFSILRQCDDLGLKYVHAEGFLESDVFLAVMNRLKKASAYSIVRC